MVELMVELKAVLMAVLMAELMVGDGWIDGVGDGWIDCWWLNRHLLEMVELIVDGVRDSWMDGSINGCLEYSLSSCSLVNYSNS